MLWTKIFKTFLLSQKQFGENQTSLNWIKERILFANILIVFEKVCAKIAEEVNQAFFVQV